jgi:hypothetical protein
MRIWQMRKDSGVQYRREEKEDREKRRGERRGEERGGRGVSFPVPPFMDLSFRNIVQLGI